MNQLIKVIFFLITFSFIHQAVLFADTLILQDESVLNGEIVEKNKDHIVFKSVHGIFTIPNYKIRSIIEDKNELPINNEPKPIKEKKYMVGIFGSYGLSTLEADVSERTGYQSPKPQYLSSYSFGASFNYYLYPFLSLKSSLSYDHKKLGILWKKDTEQSDYSQIYTFNFLTINIGGRYYLKDIFYGGFGLYYGFILGTPTLKSTGPGTNEEVDVSSLSQDAKLSGNFGSYFEIGTILPLYQDIFLDFFIKVEGSFNQIFKSSDYPSSGSWNLSPRSYLFFVGIHYLL